MLTTDSVSFDISGLELQRSSPTERLWTTERGLTVLLTVREGPPAFPALFGDETAMRVNYRQLVADAGQGLVELALVSVDGRVALRLITKSVMDPSTGWGRTFLAILDIPFDSSSVLLKVECSESSPTGARETAVIHRLLGTAALSFRPVPPEETSRMRGPADMVGWLSDPLDPTPAHLACNVSDDRQYDSGFPDHPLSLVRAFLDRAQRSLSLAPELQKLPANRQPPRRWWHVW